jgi:predicted RNA polymerase sigma factor
VLGEQRARLLRGAKMEEVIFQGSSARRPVNIAQVSLHSLPLVEAILAEGQLADYHLLPAVHGDLLARLGRRADARAALERAAALAQNQRERALLQQKARATLD